MSRSRILLAIKAPSAGPSVFGGLKIATTFAIHGAITGEFLGAHAGLGRLTRVAAFRLQTDLLFADLVLLGILGVASYGLVAGLERLVLPWHAHANERFPGKFA
jgi:NitT/TauT family transport system permease protein